MSFKPFLCWCFFGLGSVHIWQGPWGRTYGSILGWMNIHLPPLLMFTRGTGFWPTAICMYVYIHIYIYIYVCKCTHTQMHVQVSCGSARCDLCDASLVDHHGFLCVWCGQQLFTSPLSYQNNCGFQKEHSMKAAIWRGAVTF